MSGHKRLEKHKMHKKAKGGKINEYNAVGSPEVKEAKDEEEGFKKGGAKKEGGHAEGKKAKHRLDKAARGGHMKMKKHAAGGSPFTSAAKRSPYLNKGAGDGHVSDGNTKRQDEQTDKE